MPLDMATNSIGRPSSIATNVIKLTMTADAKVACRMCDRGVQKNTANALMIEKRVTPAMPSMRS